MGMFVSGRVAIATTGVIDEKDITPEIDVIFIRPAMDYGTKQRVIGSAAKLEKVKAGGNRKQRRAAKARGEKQETSMEFDVGAYQIALLNHNVLGWQGPSFKDVPCTPGNIETLNPNEPLVKVVLDEIGERNADPDDEDDDPKELTTKAQS